VKCVGLKCENAKSGTAKRAATKRRTEGQKQGAVRQVSVGGSWEEGFIACKTKGSKVRGGR
jgi:hypothetical protein